MGIRWSRWNRVHRCCCSASAKANSVQACLGRLAMPCSYSFSGLCNSCRISPCCSLLFAHYSLLRRSCRAVAAVCRNSQRLGRCYLRDCSWTPGEQSQGVVLVEVLRLISRERRPIGQLKPCTNSSKETCCKVAVIFFAVYAAVLSLKVKAGRRFHIQKSHYGWRILEDKRSHSVESPGQLR